jgi:lysophospholipase L1-like esterase
MKNYILGAITIVLAISLLMICGEIAIRVYLHLNFTQKGLTVDKELGWLPTPNYAFDGYKTDSAGISYPVKIQINNAGFRIFGNVHEKNKKKVLFLGDSFTHAPQISDNKTYYGILSNDLSLEAFAFGGSGYGTLQEYMVLDKYIDEIKPDIVILQFCSNDFINNSYELELRSTANNNGMRRPYLTKDGVIYKNPNSFSVIRDFANEYSNFLYFIITRIDAVALKVLHTNSSAEKIIGEKGRSYPYFRDSIEITELLIRKLKLRIPSTTLVYAFSVDNSEPYYDEFKRISRENEIYFIDGIPQAVSDAEDKGVTTRAEDHGHWNEAGHQIAANVLKRYIEDSGGSGLTRRHTLPLTAVQHNDK